MFFPKASSSSLKTSTTKPPQKNLFPPPPLRLTELVGTRGIEPLRTIIEQRRVPGDLLESFSGTPTVLWLLDAAGVEAGAAADLLCLLGAALAAAACAPGALGGCTPLLVALSLLYLAVIAPLAATARGSSLPWAELSSDGLLLEAAFAAALWAPLWPRGKEEEEEEEEEEEQGGGASEDSSGGSIGNTRASSTLSAPAHAPAFLLRWIVAKNAFFRGLCRWKRMKGSAATAAAAAVLSSSVSRSPPPSPASALSLVALVADVALAPLALSPARLPRLVAAAALLASWAIDVAAAVAAAASPFSLSSSKATPLPLLSSHVPPLWTLLLRPALVLPLFHAGLLDSGGGSAGKAGEESSKAKRVARLLVSAAAAVPALSSALGALSFSGSSSFEESLSKYAPLCLAAAGLTMLASLLADVLRSMSSASVGLFLEGEGEGEGETKKTSPPPMTLSMRRRREEQEAKRRAQHRSGQQQQKVQYVRGTHEPALVGAISLMLFCAGCLEVSSSVASSSSPAGAAAAGGCSGGPGCGGGPAALVVARRLSWLARPWRATGPSFGSMMIEEEERGRGGAASSASVAIEFRSDCRGDDVDDTERGWERVSPLSRSSRVAAALSSLSPRGEGEEDGGESSSAPPPPWLDHLLYRLVSDPEGPVAASFAERQQQQTLPSAAPPCAARAVIVGGRGGGRTWASFSAAEAADASSPASERLARHGWGPLVEYESPSRFGRAVADAVALPRRVLRLGGFGGKEGGGGFSVLVAGAGAACSLALSAAALAVVRRGREGSPEAAAAAASKKRD